MTSHRPYHHGNLRQEMLDRAALVLRERGASSLSLRELARDIGVSHAAPLRHFADRQALLDALAVEGFAQLSVRLQEVIAAEARYQDQVRAVAAAYLNFAISDANLMEVMFAHKHGAGSEAVSQGAVDAFTPMLEMFRRAQVAGLLPDREPERIGLLFLATLQGMASLINCGVIPAERINDLIDDAVEPYRRIS